MASFTQSASPMSTGQQQAAMQAVDTGTGAMNKGTALFNSGMGELNKVGTELGGDMEKFKGNALGNIANLKVKMNQKKEEAKAKIAQRKAEFEQYKATNAQDIANGTRYQTGINNIKAGKEKAQANLKHFNDVVVPQNKKIFAETFAAKKAEQHAKSSSSGDLANTNEGMASTMPGSGATTVGGRRRRRRRKSRRKKKSKKKKGGRKSRKRKRKRKTRKKRRRRNRKKSRRRRRR